MIILLKKTGVSTNEMFGKWGSQFCSWGVQIGIQKVGFKLMLRKWGCPSFVRERGVQIDVAMIQFGKVGFRFLFGKWGVQILATVHTYNS